MLDAVTKFTIMFVRSKIGISIFLLRSENRIILIDFIYFFRVLFGGFFILCGFLYESQENKKQNINTQKYISVFF